MNDFAPILFRRFHAACLLAAFVTITCVAGCRSNPDFHFDPQLDHYHAYATQIEFPDASCNDEPDPRLLQSAAPVTLRNVNELPTWSLTLEEAIRTTLVNSKVMRDAGGRVVSTPTAVSTIYDPALSEADPGRGVEAALSAFDAQFSTGLFFGQDERTFNNIFQSGGGTSTQLNPGQFQAEISKTAGTGTRFSLRNQIDYTRTNVDQDQDFNVFASRYEAVIEGEFRHPLLQGSGIAFNRIAGPNSAPGQYNGVLLARLNNDIALTDFERSVRDLVRDVETAYWELYFAYRDLEAKLARKAATLQTWQTVKIRLEVGRVDEEREALARQEYYAARVAVEDSLSGTTTPAGATGVHATERRLRRLMGLPTNDGRLIRPADEPLRADVLFDWNECLTEAIWRRPELRRQKWSVKQNELQLAAAENFLQMRLDLVGQYRWRGFGDNLLGQDGTRNYSAFQDLTTGDLQGWQVGLQLSTPIGNRQAHAAYRHAELQLARSRAVLREQEVQIAHDLADAFAQLDRTFTLARTNFNRAIAAQQQVDPIQAQFEEGADILLEDVLSAQSRASDATSEFFRSLVQYSQAVANVHYVRGSLLDYHEVHLSEGPWTEWAHTSALKQARRFRQALDCAQEPCRDLSQGPIAQDSADFAVIGRLPSEAGAAEQPGNEDGTTQETPQDAQPGDPMPQREGASLSPQGASLLPQLGQPTLRSPLTTPGQPAD